MRRFEVWLDRGVPGMNPETEIVEVPDDATEDDVHEACSDALDTMVSNLLDTGWRELPRVTCNHESPNCPVKHDGDSPCADGVKRRRAASKPGADT